MATTVQDDLGLVLDAARILHTNWERTAVTEARTAELAAHEHPVTARHRRVWMTVIDKSSEFARGGYRRARTAFGTIARSPEWVARGQDTFVRRGVMRMTKAREVMTTGVQTAPMAASVKDIASTMASSDVGAMPVCNDDGRLQGMITDRDITVRVVAEGRDPSSTKVGDVVDVREVVTIGADDSLEAALATMKKHKVRRLPVIDGQQLVGMISQGDIAVHLPEDKVGDLVEAISAAP